MACIPGGGGIYSKMRFTYFESITNFLSRILTHQNSVIISQPTDERKKLHRSFAA